MLLASRLAICIVLLVTSHTGDQNPPRGVPSPIFERFFGSLPVDEAPAPSDLLSSGPREDEHTGALTERYGRSATGRGQGSSLLNHADGSYSARGRLESWGLDWRQADVERGREAILHSMGLPFVKGSRNTDRLCRALQQR